MRKLYCFDFDGTLTTKDTMLEFLKFWNPRRYYVQMLLHLPLMVLLKLKLVPAQGVKESLVFGVLGFATQDSIEKKAKVFFEIHQEHLLRKNGVEYIRERQKEGHATCMVTASLDIWVRPFAEYLGLDMIATQGSFREGRYQKHFKSPNCNGAEKVLRIEQYLKSQPKFDKKIAFGDTSGDREMLAWAEESFFRFFN